MKIDFRGSKAKVLKFQDDKSVRNITVEQKADLCMNYKKICTDKSIKEIQMTHVSFYAYSLIKEFYSSKGAEIIQDYQRCYFYFGHEMNLNGGNFYPGKQLFGFYFDELLNKQDDIIKEVQKGIDFAKNAKPVISGDYECVLAPSVTL